MKKFRFGALALALCLLICSIPALAVQNPDDAGRYQEILSAERSGRLSAYFLDLSVNPGAEDKSGDSTLLIAPDGTTMLIDAGHPDSAPFIIQFLKDMGISRIVYLVASHAHIDHIGGIPAVVDAFEIGRLIRNSVEYTTQTYRNYVQAVEQKQIPVSVLQAGDTFEFGSEVKVEIFNPEEPIQYPAGFPANSTQFLNDGSLVMKFTYGGSTFLFAGDLYLTQEKKLAEKYGELLHADVIKANHHGNDTSNGRPWIKATAPKYVVAINDGMGSMDVYNLYLKKGAQFYQADFDGIVMVSSDSAANYSGLPQYDSWMHPAA